MPFVTQLSAFFWAWDWLTACTGLYPIAATVICCSSNNISDQFLLSLGQTMFVFLCPADVSEETLCPELLGPEHLHVKEEKEDEEGFHPEEPKTTDIKEEDESWTSQM